LLGEAFRHRYFCPDRGCRVVTAETPDAALAELGAAARPDLIVSDFHLANGTGIAAIAQLRTVYGAVPAFLMTDDMAPERFARGARERPSSGLQAGAADDAAGDDEPAPQEWRCGESRIVAPHFGQANGKDGDGRLWPKAGAT
jgi:CheY-like chemotaxis protein